MTRLTRTDLINWADTTQARGQLPELIRRLVLASNQTVEALEMPYGDSIGRSGLDGYVRATVASPYVVVGESVWEFGTNKDHVRKANSDFEKRTAETEISRQQTMTYHCVTPRHWEKKVEWKSKPRSGKEKVASQWKEIRVYDVDDLLGWLSDCPSVEAWFSRKLGKSTAGLRDVDGYWENVATTETGTINPDVLLAGREDLAQKVQSHLSDDGTNPRPLAISSRSPAEVVPFAVASTIESSNEAAITRTVVVDFRTRWEQVIIEESALGLIVMPQVQPTREELQMAHGSKHRVVYCSATGNLTLSRLPAFEVRQALISSGMGEGEATQHAKHCGGSGQLLLDRLSGLHVPAGAIGSRLEDRVKVACLLLVAWNGEHAADREAFSILSGSPYEEIESSLISDSDDPNGLLFRADGKFRLLSPQLAWIQYASFITRSVSSDFAYIVRLLLADDDPTAGMPGSERLAAQFLGERPEFSDTLRRNIVHSLAIAGSVDPTHLKLDRSMSPSFVDWIVRSTFEDANFLRWASFGSELSILAEAAPEALLDALERDLRPNGPLAEVMDKTEMDLFSSPAHTGILWALERLCWSQHYLERAICILLRLAILNPEIRSGNNPSSSIRETLQLYCPQTTADWETRQQTIMRMLKEDAGAAFRLVLSLFPRGHCSWTIRVTPTWRNWAYGYRAGVTYEQIENERRWCVDQLQLFAADDEVRWGTLLGLCGAVDDDQFDTILDSYESRLLGGAFDDMAKRVLWMVFNRMLTKREWSLTRRRTKDGKVVGKDELKEPNIESVPHFPQEAHLEARFGPRLRQLRNDSTPDDPVLAGCHAFLSGLGDNHCSRHFLGSSDWREQGRRIDEARSTVAMRVTGSQGLDGLRRLAAVPHVDAVGVGRAVAASSGSAEVSFEEFISLLSSTTKSDVLLASGFVRSWAWDREDSLSTVVLPLLPTLSCDETRASFLRCLPPLPEVWDCVDAQSETMRQLYWEDAPIPREIPKARISYFVSNLTLAGRGDRAVDLLVHQRKDITEDEVASVICALEALPLVGRGSDDPGHSNLWWETRELFQVLYKYGLSQIERVIRLELICHQIYDSDRERLFQPKALLIAIRDSPSFFVDLLTYLWKDDVGESLVRDADSAKAVAEKILGLLRNVAELPGQSDLCPLDGKTVAEWVSEVVGVAVKRRYLTAVGMQMIDIMTRGSWNAVGAWPAPEVADAINILADADPENCPRRLASSLSSARGIHSVDPTGRAERSQAERLRSRADQLRESCPTAARALREIAQGLDSEAGRNVERANWER